MLNNVIKTDSATFHCEKGFIGDVEIKDFNGKKVMVNFTDLRVFVCEYIREKAIHEIETLTEYELQRLRIDYRP